MKTLSKGDWVEVIRGPRKGEVGEATFVRDGLVGIYIHGSAYCGDDPTTYTVPLDDVLEYLDAGKGYIFALSDERGKRIGRFKGFPFSPCRFVMYNGKPYTFWSDGTYHDAGCYVVTNIRLDSPDKSNIKEE